MNAETLFTCIFPGTDHTIEITSGDLQHVDIAETGNDALHMLYGEFSSRRIQVVAADPGHKEYVLRIGGNDITVRLRDPVEERVHAMGFDRTNNRAAQHHIISPMPGLVLQILLAEGAAVVAGQPVIILEAMKMENVLKAPCDGRIAQVHVRDGESINKGALLVEIKPVGASGK